MRAGGATWRGRKKKTEVGGLETQARTPRLGATG